MLQSTKKITFTIFIQIGQGINLTPLTEMSTRNVSWVVKAADAYGWQPYHLHVPTVLKCGSLNLLEPSVPVQACNGIALPLPLPVVNGRDNCLLTWVGKKWGIQRNNLLSIISKEGAPGSAVVWGTALHAGRSRVRFPMVTLKFFIDIILPASLWPWGWLSL